MVEDVRLMRGDCLELMASIPDGSVDMVMCDLPYGTTQCPWDAVIPFEVLWKNYWRVAKNNAAIVLTAAQPFTSALIMSQVCNFKYTLTWDKINSVRNHLNAKKQPMRVKEDVCVFYKKQPTYKPQMRPGGYISRKTQPGQSAGFGTVSGVDKGRVVTGLYPLDIVGFEGHDPNNVVHPTQKPVALMDYLIRTYTNPGDVVLDNCMGSGTTGVAALECGRRFVGIEKDEKYFEIAERRIKGCDAYQVLYGDA